MLLFPFVSKIKHLILSSYLTVIIIICYINANILDYYYVEEIVDSSELPEFNVTFNVEPYWLERSTTNLLCMDYNSIVYMYNHSLCIDESLLLFPLLHATIDECSTCL